MFWIVRGANAIFGLALLSSKRPEVPPNLHFYGARALVLVDSNVLLDLATKDPN